MEKRDMLSHVAFQEIFQLPKVGMVLKKLKRYVSSYLRLKVVEGIDPSLPWGMNSVLESTS